MMNNQTLKDVKQLFVKFNYILNRRQKKQSILILVVIILGAIFETIGVSAILPFIQAMMVPKVIMDNIIIKKIMSIFQISTETDLIILIGIGVISLYFIKNTYLALSLYLQKKFQLKVEEELSTFMLMSYMKRPYTFFLKVNSGEIVRNVETDVYAFDTMLGSTLKLMAEVLTVTLIGIFIFMQDSMMALIILILAGLCMLATVVGFKPLLKRNGIKSRKYAADKYKHIYQATNGIKEIKVMRREAYFNKNYENAIKEFEKTKLVQNFVTAVPEKIIETVCVGGLIAVLCVRTLYGENPATYLPQLATFAMAAFRILPSIARIMSAFNEMIFLMPSTDAVYTNLQEVEKYENQLVKENYKEEVKNEFNKIELKNIYWKYPEGKKNILENASLTILKGESIGFVGSSGCGKTTTADIILGLLIPQKGSVLLDEVDIFAIPRKWSQMIGYVPQNTFIADDTIKNNIAFGIESEDIDEEAVWSALERAQLKEYVKSLPKQLETELGERGIRFSGGQKQRIAIARALYYDPQILLLDEATAALDNETEQALMEAIEKLQGEKTLIIVAHRLSTIEKCDKIYEFLNGKAYLK